MTSSNIAARPEEQPERGTGEPGHSDPAAVGAAQEAGRRRTRNVLHVLGNREFALFWSGQPISQTGTWMQQFAQGWVVTTLAGSALALASVNFAASIPMLILMPFGGVAADRMERRRILLVTQSVMAVLAVLLVLLIQAHRLHLWHVWLIAAPASIPKLRFAHGVWRVDKMQFVLNMCALDQLAKPCPLCLRGGRERASGWNSVAPTRAGMQRSDGPDEYILLLSQIPCDSIQQ